MSVSPNPTFQIRPNRSFVYGWFRWPKEDESIGALERIWRSPDPDIALEILREYGPSEMLGRIHVMQPGANWTRLSPTEASSRSWYAFYLQNHRDVFFEMKGSGLWQVANFRNESDETGPYVAAALSFQPSNLPEWLSPREIVRRRVHIPGGRRRRMNATHKDEIPRPERA